jgi:hypothetical protein
MKNWLIKAIESIRAVGPFIASSNSFGATLPTPRHMKAGEVFGVGEKAFCHDTGMTRQELHKRQQASMDVAMA